MSFGEIINYELVTGNNVWRFAIMLFVIVATMIIGKMIQFTVTLAADKRAKKIDDSVLSLFLHALAKPINVAFFTIALQISRLCLIFDIPETETVEGIRVEFLTGWDKITQALWALTLAYALYRLVDVVEHFIYKAVSKTETKLDDMLVPVIRKSLRITIAIVSTLLIAENIFGTKDIKSLILSAGVGGIAIALAAKDTIANFFGSITIFADRPFQIEELVKINGQSGFVEEVGFRSTKLRTLQGHQVVMPNNTVANSEIENIGRRPFIRNTFTVTITYDSGFAKTKRAVDIIKDVLSKHPELNQLPDKMPRVYFKEFASHSLNIYVSFWFTPADYWLNMETTEKINFEILERFDNGGIEFAFPTQTLYMKKSDELTNQ